MKHRPAFYGLSNIERGEGVASELLRVRTTQRGNEGSKIGANYPLKLLEAQLIVSTQITLLHFKFRRAGERRNQKNSLEQAAQHSGLHQELQATSPLHGGVHDQIASIRRRVVPIRVFGEQPRFPPSIHFVLRSDNPVIVHHILVRTNRIPVKLMGLCKVASITKLLQGQQM